MPLATPSAVPPSRHDPGAHGVVVGDEGDAHLLEQLAVGVLDDLAVGELALQLVDPAAEVLVLLGDLVAVEGGVPALPHRLEHVGGQVADRRQHGEHRGARRVERREATHVEREQADRREHEEHDGEPTTAGATGDGHASAGVS
jgi:hypothetical protein